MSRTIQCYTALCNSFQLHLYLYNNKMSAIAIKCQQRTRHITPLEAQVLAWDKHKHVRGLNLFMGMYGYIFGLCNMSKYILVNWWFHNVERQIVHVNSKFSNT
jgi:hypothetical protein